jgi:hypothetical protein
MTKRGHKPGAKAPPPQPVPPAQSKSQAEPPATKSPPTEIHLPYWAVLLVLGGVFIALAAWSWRKWPDIQIDYGQQLYFPWQIASGKVMFRDMKYVSGGPLSQCFHALVFKIFCVSFTALIVTNLAILALLILLIHRLFLRMADEWTALMACLVTLCIFSFSQYTDIANFNYICPYAYEAFHGLVLSVAAIACLCQWSPSRKDGWMFLTGVCLGGVFLGKPELFVAAAGAFAAGLLMEWLSSPASPRRWRSYFLLFIGFASPVAAFLVYYSLVWNLPGGITAVAGSWIPLLTTNVSHSAFFRWGLGLDQPGTNLMLMFRRFGGFVVGVACIAMFCRPYRRGNAAIRAGLGALLCVLWWWSTMRFRWSRCGSALGPITLLGFAFLLCKWWTTRKSPENRALVLPLLWSVFALGLLSKMGLMPRLFHYGFYLGMPAALFAVVLIFDLLPAELRRFQVNAAQFRAVAAIFILPALGQMVWESNLFYRDKTFPVGTGADEILAVDPKLEVRGAAFQETVAWVQANTAPSSTIAVLPQGTLINFLTRRPNPTPYVCLTPSEIEAYGEANIKAAYVRTPPDYIILVSEDASDWKLGYFGTQHGYGYDIMQWIRANYTPVWGLGPEPLQTRRFGIRILKKSDPMATQ